MSEAPVKELYRGRADGVRGDEGKAAAHALRAAAAPSAPPRAAILGQPRPLLREYRRPRRTAVRVGPLSAQDRCPRRTA